MRIGVLTEWYDPEVGSPAVVGTVTRALASMGHDVQVLTGFPNYPSGNVYDGYRLRPTMQETLRGIPVRRVWLYPSHDASFVKRCLTYLSFAASASVLGVRDLRDVDVLLVFCSPVTVGIPAMVLRRTSGVPTVLFVQDVWPETVWASGMAGSERPGLVRRLLQWGSDRVYRDADRVAVITSGARAILVDRGVRAETTDVIYNWVDETIYRPRPRVERPGEPFVIMYAGSVGHVQGLDVAVRALAQLDDLPDVRLSIVGDGVALAGLQSLATELGVADRVQVHGSVPQERAASMMADSHVQLVSLRDLPVFRYTLPSKIQAAMASALPIVGMLAGDPAELVLRAGAGLVSPPGDVDALAHAFRGMRQMPDEARNAMGMRGRAFYERELAQDVGVHRLLTSLTKAQHRTRARAERS